MASTPRVLARLLNKVQATLKPISSSGPARITSSGLRTAPNRFSSSPQQWPSPRPAAACNQAGGVQGDLLGQPAQDPFVLVGSDLDTMVHEIHAELGRELQVDTELGEMAKYYFDGAGKGLRPVIAMCVGHAFNIHTGRVGKPEEGQRMVAIISEMIHTASLVHDDILDHAETRRGKVSVNLRWGGQKSTMAGAYILAVASKLLARTGSQEVVEILSQVLADLVQGEFMQLQTKQDEEDRFEDYINKSFNKTASLMAYSCQANAVLAEATTDEAHDAFLYGKHLGIAFQLVDDLLDFVSSADMLGKPAAADLQLGLATAPVLFASSEFPQLHAMITRRFNEPGDVEEAFRLVLLSQGLEQTRQLARQHCEDAIASLSSIKPSPHRAALVGLCDKVLNRLN